MRYLQFTGYLQNLANTYAIKNARARVMGSYQNMGHQIKNKNRQKTAVSGWQGAIRVPTMEIALSLAERFAAEGRSVAVENGDLLRACQQARRTIALMVRRQVSPSEGEALLAAIRDLERPSLWIGRQPKADRPLCGARTRAGTPCQARAVEGKDRCRMHGGLSTGPRTAEGRARLSEALKARHARRRAEKIAERGGIE